MDLTSLTSTPALSQYATALLAKQQQQQQQAASGSTAAQAADPLMSRLTAARTDFKSTTAQHTLDKQQAALGQELASGLAKLGLKVGADVSFSVASDGSIAVDGSAADKATVQDYLKSDTSNPSLESRIGSVLKSAQALSTTTQQSNAISMAARYGGAATNVMAMYAQFMGHTDATPATLNFSGTASSLSYPGALDSQA